jgi:sugar phosphate isomerase/epimerase
MELAAAIGCPNVRLFLGDIEANDTQPGALTRIAGVLASLVSVATRLDVRLLVENGGDFPSSRDLWFVIDSVSHPMVQACWNQCNALATGERPTNSIPRLGKKIRMVHLCDADFDGDGILLGYRQVGEGGAEVGRQIELLRGLLYDDYLIFEWPKLWVPSLAAPEAVLPQVATFLRGRLEERQAVLSAYKGDKTVPRLAKRSVPTTAG